MILWSPSEKEDGLIQKDYDIIRNKIKAGEVNSEDNDFLGHVQNIKEVITEKSF